MSNSLLMQVTRAADGRSVTTQARRAQIVQATIAVIAAEGHRQASFARIAEHGGLSSTRLISYHFAGKDDLVSAVVHEVIDDMGAWVGARVLAESSARGALRAYIDGVVTYAAGHRDEMVALLQILMAGGFPATVQAEASAAGHVERILAEGRRTGEFRDFDVRVMAMAVQRSVEGVALALSADRDLDVEGYAVELCTLFELATRRDLR
jgi:AcrR family transcriptional regulator